MGRFLVFSICVASVWVNVAGGRRAAAHEKPPLTLKMRTQELCQNEWGGNFWKIVETEQRWNPTETAVIVCDVWDEHWSQGATRRVAEMAPRMNIVVQTARSLGLFIVHAPSDTMDFYKGTAARQRMLEAPRAAMPEPAPHPDPPQPVDSSDGGSDTNEKPWRKAWSRQHPVIEIDQSKDGISDNGQEVWNALQQRGIKNVIIMGVHTNMCVLNRSFAIKALVTRGVNVALVRDLTDPMYNPAQPPYVDHEVGRQLMIGYVEKFWCPTIPSRQILDAGQ